MSKADDLRKEIEDLERDFEEDEKTGWVLGDAHESLSEMRRQLKELERDERVKNLITVGMKEANKRI